MDHIIYILQYYDKYISVKYTVLRCIYKINGIIKWTSTELKSLNHQAFIHCQCDKNGTLQNCNNQYYMESNKTSKKKKNVQKKVNVQNYEK